MSPYPMRVYLLYLLKSLLLALFNNIKYRVRFNLQLDLMGFSGYAKAFRSAEDTRRSNTCTASWSGTALSTFNVRGGLGIVESIYVVGS